MTERRSARRGQRAASPLLQLPFRQLRNPFQPLEILAPEQVEKLHDASMRLLEETGLLMMDAETLSLWEAAGAQVDHASQNVRLDRGLVLELVAKAPRSFVWRARDPAKSIFVGENAITFAPQGGVAYATDLDNGRRRGSLKDYQNFLKLIQLSGPLHYAGEQVMALYEVENSLRHLTRLSSAITLTDKALLEAAHGRVVTDDSLNLARLVFSDIETGGPVIGGIINASSPLRYDQRMLGGLLTYARAGQVNILTPFVLAGATGPITMAGGLAQQNAEALAGIALAQLARPGAPVMYGGFMTNVDMKSGSPAMGTPEGAWAMIAGAQLARRYGLPYRGSGSFSTAKAPDAEAVMETMWTTWPAVLAHTNFIMHAVGWLEGGLCASYEKFVIDLETVAMFYHFLNGFAISAETLALDMIAQVGPGGHHFDTPHTQARYATEFYQSSLADRAGYETWQAQGGLDAAQRANTLWKEMLAAYQPPPLDPGVREAITDYVARRTRELEGKSLYE
jgi:trimethylamine--corrinoid protein Co-methyltransferase